MARPISPKQRRYLLDLAMQAGETLVMPGTSEEAKKEIARFQKLAARDDRRDPPDGSIFPDADGAVAVHDDEIAGYGSSATFRSSRRRAR